jgi:biopolymer transport protein ExbB/TolQ
VAWAGLWVGNRAHVSVTPAMLARMIGAALFLTGAGLIVRTF